MNRGEPPTRPSLAIASSWRHTLERILLEEFSDKQPTIK